MAGDRHKSLESSLSALSGLSLSLVLSGEGPREQSWEKVTVSNLLLSVKKHIPGCPHPPECQLPTRSQAVPISSQHHLSPTRNLPLTSRPYQKAARGEPSFLPILLRLQATPVFLDRMMRQCAVNLPPCTPRTTQGLQQDMLHNL